MNQNHPPNQSGQSYWNARWENRQTGWDVGMASPAITTYMERCDDKSIAILIPGCGNAHEAGWLLQNGFTNITLIDIASAPVAQLQEKYAGRPEVTIILGDFFAHSGQYDVMIEQTFFCAVDPALRERYVEKAAELLERDGRIIGVLFNVHFEENGPPFGGDTNEYEQLFMEKFEIKKMENCYNSIAPRAGREVFINLIKK